MHLDSGDPFEFEKTGISITALRIVDCPIFPMGIALFRKSRHENQPDNGVITLRGIRIVDIFLFSLFGVFGSSEQRF